ncbi:cell division protein FtsZ [Moraxella oblonga]|uniref:cell division protein FtsZ n=1 Tax=Moraxella oblonga TaxID=200413 RepID=UPI000831FF15|nr:cell division protein FtsZ [Moraxella oblonga]
MSKYSISEDMQSEHDGQPRFIVFGVGGGGGNAVEHMVQQGIRGVTFVVANTDRQALNLLTVPNKIQLGNQTTRGLGAGADPEVGREAAESDEDEIRSLLDGYDMVFITAGMGGGTGTGAAPVVARIAKEMGILTVAVVTTPFDFEGKKRAKAAKEGIEQLAVHVDSIITIPNQKLQQVYRQMSLKDAFKKADDVLLHAVNGLAQTIATAGVMNIDFNDIRTAMTAKGHAMMGVGRASGEDRARQATEKAIRSPLLDDLRLENAKGLLINITAAELMMGEPEEIASVVDSITDLEEGNIFYGFVEDDSMGDDIHVTVIATGLTIDDRPKYVPPVHAMPTDHTSALSHQQHQSQPQIRQSVKRGSVIDYLQTQQSKN